MDCKVKSEMPYPEVGIANSPYEVSLIIPAYGGRESETTAIFGYIYQSYVLKNDYAEISACLEKIAITEMHHHDLLGGAIVNLGGTPYIGGLNGYWNGGYVNYTRNLNNILNNDIMSENRAIKGYREIIRRSKSEEVKAMIARIIEDEEIHIETLTGILNSLK